MGRQTKRQSENPKPSAKQHLKLKSKETEEEEQNYSKILESDDDGESDFSGGEGSYDASDPSPDTAPSRPAETRAATRRVKMGRQTKRQSENPKPSAKQHLKVKSKRQSKVKSLVSSLDKKEKPVSPSTDEDGSDHAEDDGCQRKGISLKSTKRSRSTFEVSRECKKTKLILGDNGTSPPPNEIAQSGETPRNAESDPASPAVDASLTIKKVDIDEGGRKREASVLETQSEDEVSQEKQKTRTTKADTEGNIPMIDSNPRKNMESPPSLTSTSDMLEWGEKSKVLTESDLIMTNIHNSKRGLEVDTAGNGQADASENDNQGVNDQTSTDSPMQIVSQENDHHNNCTVLLARADNVDKFKRRMRNLSLKKNPSTPSSPPDHREKGPSSGGMASASTEVTKRDFNRNLDYSLPSGVEASSEVKRQGVDGNLNNTRSKPNVAIGSKVPGRNKSCRVEYSPKNNVNNYAGKDEDGSLVLDSITSGQNSNKPLVEKLDTNEGLERMDETALHHRSKQASKDMECSSSSERLIRGLHVANELRPARAVSSTIRYHKPKRSGQAPGVGQLKMALFLEASNAHRGNGAEKMFSIYCEALEKYIIMGSHGVAKHMRSDCSASFAGIEATLMIFLKTRKMKRLHNKLVLAMMMEATRTSIPADYSAHVPQHWHATPKKPKPNQLNKEERSVHRRDRKLDLLQWDADFGPCSGTWSACGDELALKKNDSQHSICPKLIGSIQKAGLEEEEVPSASLPGALEIEPLVRKHTADLGLTASENAIWMLVVAVREHSSSLIKKIIANDQDFDKGFAPSLPTHFQTSLACHHPTSVNDDNAQCAKNSGEGRKLGKNVISSTSLSHVLEQSPSVASRLTSMRTAVISDNRGISSCSPGLDNVNCIINASIQRGARRRQRSSTGYQNAMPTVTTLQLTSIPPAQTDAGPVPKLDGNLAKAQASATRPFSTTALPINQPHLAFHTKNQSIPPPLPLQSQMALPSMRSHNMQPLNSAQLMSYSDHTRASKPFEQQTLPISRADISNLEPLTKPGFPSFMNVSQKPEPSQNSVPKTSSPPSKASRRGSKNLAAMMAKPQSQPKPAPDKGSTAGNVKNANGASLVKATPARHKEETKEKEDAKDKRDVMNDTKPPTTGSARPRGRAFGVKNLARMRAKASFSDSGK